MSLMKHKAIIFDFDGVLVDSERMHLQAANQVFSSLNFTIHETEYFQRYVGLPDNIVFDLILKEKNLSFRPEEIEIMKQNKISAYKNIIQQLPFIHGIPGVKPFIDTMAEKMEHFGVCTAAAREEVETTLEKLEHGSLKKYFKTIVTIDDVCEGKPSPEGYLLAAQRLLVSPHQCLVIEDTQKGANAAKAAGMDVVAITTSHEKAHFKHVDFIADNYQEIADWIQK